ncbi:hypothetical protein CALVIDRAFT_533267 [Calocera viscosa TUFC12733]|uniref:F-box domain-containing protein n=1 Tax=Calocera viscosa (strain TUFC12733) TaxID=1330018 RepID=A0A167RII9_CALVF|nr:hypothetical protein CALVIDRAFT_533267 [Calocera viscosa TUFC12733]
MATSSLRVATPQHTEPMHRIFTIPDLIREITERLDRKRDTYHFALTCRTIWDNSIPYIWYDVDEESLGHIFPADLADKTDPAAMVRPLTTVERAVVQRYTSYVHYLTLDDCFASVHQHLNLLSCLPVVEGSAREVELFPALQALYLRFVHEPRICPFIRPSTMSNLHQLSIRLAWNTTEECISGYINLFDAIKGTVHLRALHVHVHDFGRAIWHSKFSRFLMVLLEKAHKLRMLELDSFEMDSDVIQIIRRLPQLQHLRIRGAYCPLVPTEIGFLSLQSLHHTFQLAAPTHSGLFCFLTSPPSQGLRSIEMMFPSAHLRTLCHILADRFSESLTDLNLAFIGHRSQPMLTEQELAPLTKCAALRSVKLQGGFGDCKLRDCDIIAFAEAWPKLELFRLNVSINGDHTGVSFHNLLAFSRSCPRLHTLCFPVDFEGFKCSTLSHLINPRLKELHMEPYSNMHSTAAITDFLHYIFPELQTLYCIEKNHPREAASFSLPGTRSDPDLKWWFEYHPGKPLPPSNKRPSNA